MSMSLPPEDEPEETATKSLTANWWEIIVSTPVRDALRGDWSARLSYKQILRDAALPSPITDRIVRIVRKAHLWRNERNDVTRELIAHFQEGLDRGTSAALLVDQFGDVQTTARLIRRAKLRKRPIWWKTWYGVSRSFAALLAIFSVVYVVQAIRFFTGQPVISRNIVKELNEPVRKIPVEDRAWPLYVEAMKGFPEWPNGLHEFVSANPQTEQWPQIVELVHANRTRIDSIRIATEKPHLGWLIGDPNDPAFQMSDADDKRFAGVKTDSGFLEDSNPSSLEVRIPISQLLMEMSRLLQLSTKVAVEEKDATEVYNNMIASFELAEQVFQANVNGVLLLQMFGITIFKTSTQLLLDVLKQSPELLSVDQLDLIKGRLMAFNSEKVIRFSCEAERFQIVDLLQRTYTPGARGVLCYGGRKQLRGWYPYRTDETFGDSNFYWIDLLGPIAMSIAVNRTQAEFEYNDFLFRETVRFASRPWEWKHDEFDAYRHLDRNVLGFLRNPIASLLYPASNALADHAERAELSRNTAVIALALTIFKRQEGHWPERLDELVPRYISRVPSDPNDGQSFRYKLTDTGPVVYSIGVDRHDDGGQATNEQEAGKDPVTLRFLNAEKRQAIHDDPYDPQHGDWILWPPVSEKDER